MDLVMVMLATAGSSPLRGAGRNSKGTGPHGDTVSEGEGGLSQAH